VRGLTPRRKARKQTERQTFAITSEKCKEMFQKKRLIKTEKKKGAKMRGTDGDMSTHNKERRTQFKMYSVK
jgi:hypothetical protein